MNRALPRTAFSFSELERSFEEELMEVIRRLLDAERAKYINPKNALSYTHGGRWLEDKGPDAVGESSFEQHGHELSLHLKDVVDHKLEVLPEYVAEIVSTFTKDFVRSLFSKIEEVTDRTGNVVDQKKHPTQALAIVEMLEKIQFGVDRDGKVSRPTIHLGKEGLAKLRASLEAGGSELTERIDAITARKESEAIEREQARKKRFKGLR